MSAFVLRRIWKKQAAANLLAPLVVPPFIRGSNDVLIEMAVFVDSPLPSGQSLTHGDSLSSSTLLSPWREPSVQRRCDPTVQLPSGESLPLIQVSSYSYKTHTRESPLSSFRTFFYIFCQIDSRKTHASLIWKIWSNLTRNTGGILFAANTCGLLLFAR